MLGCGRALSRAPAAAAVLTLTSCASIPTAGSTWEGAEVRSDQEQPFIRTIARPPRPGMTKQLVNGFLEVGERLRRRPRGGA